MDIPKRGPVESMCPLLTVVIVMVVVVKRQKKTALTVKEVCQISLSLYPTKRIFPQLDSIEERLQGWEVARQCFLDRAVNKT